MGGIYIERANKQTQEKSERKGWGDGEMRARASGCVGTWGPGRKRASLGAGGFPACSKRAGEAAAVRQREHSGQVPRDLVGGNARVKQLGAKLGEGWGTRGPGLLNKAGARWAWLLTTRSSCRPWRGLRARRSRGLGVAATSAARQGEEGEGGEDEEAGNAGCSAAATCSALLVPMAGRGCGSGKRKA